MAPTYLSEATQRRMGKVIRRALLDSADAQEVGGDQWMITRRTGGGLNSPVVPVTLGPIIYHVYQRTPTVPLMEPGTISVQTDDWRGAGPFSEDLDLVLQNGDRITSLVNPLFKLDVVQVTNRHGVMTTELEVVR